MAGKVIGYMNLSKGFAGQVSRSIDNIVESYVNEDNKAIAFGAPVVLGGTKGGVKNFVGGTSTAAQFVGIAVRIAKTENTYATDDACYNANEITDILTRGTVSVKVAGVSTTAPALGGTVYINANGEFTAVSASTTALSNVKFKSTADGNGIAEVAVLTRNL